MSFIEMKNMCKRYAGAEKNSVTDFNLSIEKGEFRDAENRRHSE